MIIVAIASRHSIAKLFLRRISRMHLKRKSFVVLATGFLISTSFHFGTAQEPEKPRNNAAVSIELRAEDENGVPVAGADAGFSFEIDPKLAAGISIEDRQITDQQGRVVLRLDNTRKSEIRIYVREHARNLVAVGKLKPDDFQDGKAFLQLKMIPECWVSCRVVCRQLEERNKTPTKGMVAYITHEGVRLAHFISKTEAAIKFPLPPGSYNLDTYGKGFHSSYSNFEIQPGQREFDLGTIDHSPTQLALLEGLPAPELVPDLPWKNSPPLKLKEFRGKVVLLEFWGWWCAPCVRKSIPTMMELQQKYDGKDLIIIGIHCDLEKNDVKTFDALDVKLQSTRDKLWQGRDISFPLVLVPPKRTPLGPMTADMALNEVAAQYGVDGYPTTIMIDKQGNVVGQFLHYKPEHHVQLQQLISTEYRPTVAAEEHRDNDAKPVKQ